MTKDKIVSVIDLGSSKITTVVATIAENEKPHVIGFASLPSKGFKRGQIVDIESVITSLTQSVEGAERMAGVNIGSAYISVGSANLISKNSRGVVAVGDPNNEIVKEDVDRVIEAARAVTVPPSYEVIHVIPREFIVDGQTGIRDPKGMMGIRLEVDTHLVFESLSNIRNILKALKELGIELEKFIYDGLASSLAVLSETEKDLGVVMLDIGSGKTDLAVWIDGSLAYSGVLPVGALHVTKDIALGLRVSLESAEQIKLFLTKKFHESDEETRKKDAYKDEFDIRDLNIAEGLTKVSKKTLIEGIIKPRLLEIFTLAKNALSDAGFTNATPAGVVLTGGGALTLGVLETARAKLELPTRLGVPVALSGLTDEIQNSSQSSTVGLLLYAQEENKKVHDRGRSTDLFKKIPVGKVVAKVGHFFKNFLP